MTTNRYRLHRLILESDTNIGSINLNKTYSSSSSSSFSSNNDMNFEGNMVIILAALLCALICALGLHSIVRCAVRCSRMLGNETEDGDLASSSTGLKKGVLKQIPGVVYKPGLRIPATDCPICLGEFMEGEQIRVLPKCGHGFHVKCIDRWLVLHSSCPTCRQPFIMANCVVEPVNLQIV